MRVSVLSGIFSDENGDFRHQYPENLIPVPKGTGASRGYLRPGYGSVETDTGPGNCRGGINWNGTLYRVLGTKLCRISSVGLVTELGSIPGVDLVTMNYSFDRLSITADNKLYYYNGSTLTQVTDADLGNAIDHIWVDGYFMTHDGTNIVVTELSDPTAVDPTKYGSSEADPDPIKALLKLRKEPYVLNRYTIEVFDNVGGTGFPFSVIPGAQIEKGTLGTHCNCVFDDAIAFLGSGREESPGVHIGVNGNSEKISTQEIDDLIQEFTEAQLSECLMESVMDRSHEWLLLHLPNKTLVYDARASRSTQQPVWFVLHSGSVFGTYAQYRIASIVWCYDQWCAADLTSPSIGHLDKSIGSHWGNHVNWAFNTQSIYNEGDGAIVHEIELEALTGRTAFGDDPSIFTQYTNDSGWSTPRGIKAGKVGERQKRLVWLQQGSMRKNRIQRFFGDTKSHISPTILQMRLEPLTQ